MNSERLRMGPRSLAVFGLVVVLRVMDPEGHARESPFDIVRRDPLVRSVRVIIVSHIPENAKQIMAIKKCPLQASVIPITADIIPRNDVITV